MAGIFPAAGTAAANTANAASPVNTAPGCDPLYHRIGCVPVFDPAAANALISEIVNAVNTLSPYDCTRLDNLANVLSTISDLCKLPTLTEIGVAAPDLDDTLAGCFDGETAQVSISALAALINAQKSICGLQNVGALADTDYVAVCANPGDGYRDAKLQFSLLKQLIGGGSASALVPGVQIYNNTVFSDGGHNVSIGTGGKDCFLARVDSVQLVGPWYQQFRVATGGSGEVSVWDWVDQAGNIYHDSNGPTAARTFPARLWVALIKKQNIWFAVMNGIAIPLGADDGTVRFIGGSYTNLAVWDASKF